MSTLLKLVNEFAKTEVEQDYILDLGNEALEQVEMFYSNKDVSNFQDILDIALTSTIHYWDLETETLMKKNYPDVDYSLIRANPKSDWKIEQTEDGKFIAKIGILPDQFEIMSLLNTLRNMCEHIFEDNIANEIIIYNVENGKEFDKFI